MLHCQFHRGVNLGVYPMQRVPGRATTAPVLKMVNINIAAAERMHGTHVAQRQDIRNNFLLTHMVIEHAYGWHIFPYACIIVWLQQPG